MKINHTVYGNFPEVLDLNSNFKPDIKKIKFTLDTTISDPVDCDLKTADLSILVDYFPSLKEHTCGHTLTGDLSCPDNHLQSNTILTLHKNVDIAHYLEHMIIDLLFRFGNADQVSGVTTQAIHSTGNFDVYIECENPQVGVFVLNLALAIMHQAIYCKKIDPRYLLAIDIAEWVIKQGNPLLTIEQLLSQFNGDSGKFRYCLNVLSKFQFSLLPQPLQYSLEPDQMEPILIIEDDNTARTVFTDCLRHLGYHTISVSNGTEGVEKLSNFSAGAAIIDIYLPDIDGMAISSWLREVQPTLPIILTSGCVDLKDELVSVDGSISFLGKPFRLVELKELIQNAHS